MFLPLFLVVTYANKSEDACHAALQRVTVCGPQCRRKVPVRRAEVKPGEEPYLIARIGLNRRVFLDAAQQQFVSKVVAGACYPSIYQPCPRYEVQDDNRRQRKVAGRRRRAMT